MSKTTRKQIIKILRTKYSKEEAVSYEKEIWKKTKELEKDTSLRDSLYNKWSYELAGQLLSNDIKPDRILKDIKGNNKGWKSRAMSSYKKSGDKEELDVSVLLIKGNHTCRNPKCRSTKCFVSEHQLNRGDEGMKTEVTCSICAYHYTK